jgi:tetratricopeptide (TPR) repeat protein
MLKRLPFMSVGTLWILVAATMPAAAGGAEPTPTFSRDVAPIVARACASCHRPDGDAPFALTTYSEVRARARQIVTVTADGYMPPWKPDAPSGTFAGERRLSRAEIDTLKRWAEADAPAGDAAVTEDAAASAASGHSGSASSDNGPDRGGWQHGTPDLVLELPAYALRADGADVFRNFVVTVPGRGTRYVQGLQFRPRSRAVHHANIRVDPTTASRRLDLADPEPGYEGLILHSADYPDGHFLGWTPGQAPALDSALAWRLDAGSDLVVQLHLRPTGKVETVRPLVGLYFTDRPPKQTPAIIRLGRQNLDIPAGAASSHVTDSFVLPVDAELRAIQPHAHYRAREVSAWAVLPDGTRRSLLHIPRWDFNWQDQYRYASPFWLPSGTTLAMEYVFDNSAANARNPTRPPQRATWGWRSSDEMADVWIQVLTRSDADRARFQQRADEKMLTEDAVGGEVLLQREPDHVALRNDTALIYMKLGRPAAALEHFRAVTRLEPQSASAWFNEGVALDALGSKADAAARYDRAIALKPDYAAAHVNRGTLFVADGNLDAARREYERAVDADPASADAHANLAFVRLAGRQADAALAEMDRALQLDPPRIRRLTPFAWLLVAHADAASRRPARGRELAERIVAATARQDPDALDVLAAADAALGRFDEAIATASEALSLAATGSSLADDIRHHIADYRQQRTITLK